MMMGRGVPHDWTLGTGVFPAGGVITVNAAPDRVAIFVQNQDTTQVTIKLSAQIPNTGNGPGGSVPDTSCTANIQLAPGAAAGSQGGADGLGNIGLMTNAAFTVVGTAGKQVCVLTM